VIVDKHSGTIDIETGENRGTTFVIRLPIDIDRSKDE
jgi:signal transduction histidine kinase